MQMTCALSLFLFLWARCNGKLGRAWNYDWKEKGICSIHDVDQWTRLVSNCTTRISLPVHWFIRQLIQVSHSKLCKSENKLQYTVSLSLSLALFLSLLFSFTLYKQMHLPFSFSLPPQLMNWKAANRQDTWHGTGKNNYTTIAVFYRERERERSVFHSRVLTWFEL